MGVCFLLFPSRGFRNGGPKRELQVRTGGIMFVKPVLCSQVLSVSFSPPQNLPVWPWSSNKMIGKGLEKTVRPKYSHCHSATHRRDCLLESHNAHLTVLVHSSLSPSVIPPYSSWPLAFFPNLSRSPSLGKSNV